jgi:hypothetical protein
VGTTRDDWAQELAVYIEVLLEWCAAAKSSLATIHDADHLSQTRLITMTNRP